MPVVKAGETRALPLRIRRANAGDVPAMMAIEKQAATAAHWSPGQYQAVFSGEGPSRLALVIEQEIEAQGFIVGTMLGDEWEVENIAVAESARRHGYGSRLLAEFLDLSRAQGARSVFLEVRQSNQAARRLYGKSGFIVGGRRQRYYREPLEDAILYWLELK
jgi:ribosomal-protein-alanine N-acetyltransferase